MDIPGTWTNKYEYNTILILCTYVKTLGHWSWQKFYLMINETFFRFVLPKCLSARPHWIPPPHWRVPGHDKTWSIAQRPHPLIQKKTINYLVSASMSYTFLYQYTCACTENRTNALWLYAFVVLWNTIHPEFSFCFIDFSKNLSTGQ